MMSLLRLVVDPGGSLLKGFYTLERFEPELILMEPEVATVPLEILENYELTKIGSSNPENSAWIEYQDKCQAVGFLARKRFHADLQLQKRKFELALPKVLAMVGAIADKHDLENGSSIHLGILLPWGEYQDRVLFQELVTTALAKYKFKGCSKAFSLELFLCLPEGGGILTRGRAPGSDLKEKSFAVVMLGYRDTSILLIERGEMSKGKTEPLGFSKMVESVKRQTSGLDLAHLTSVICKAGKSSSHKALEELASDLDQVYKEHEVSKIRKAVTNSRQEYWMMLSNWLKLQVPRDIDEVIISGGTAYYFQSQLNNLFSFSNINWCEILETQLMNSFPQAASKSLNHRLTDVYGLFFFLCAKGIRQNSCVVAPGATNE
ncbi:ParM/StbA family protein [Desmonostoc muscorum LEGE 12446]|nr:ParM/StbA family protein [Desmonostoc muscorum]MCF2151945.1 ParM/StbA family protein [Desmonostoc muscorum LEGE 12446]